MLDNLLEFLREQKPDILAMQEVSSGRENFCEDKTLDLFDEIKKSTGLHGFSVPSRGVRYPDGEVCVDSTAFLTRYPVVSDVKTIWLRDYREYDSRRFRPEEEKERLPRNAIHAQVRIDGRNVNLFTGHFAWSTSPTDSHEKMRQIRILVDYIRKLGGEPFILTGDFNMPPNTHVMEEVSAIGRNWVVEAGIKATLHPKIHHIAKVKPLFVVDYIFTSGHFRPVKIAAPVMPVSDHLPVIGEFELQG
ncbi:MAG: endonuclease/exonuclease/phosphatase family protein [Candidatus Aenigmarchaeota archaeon]|nr:endonuclease/exonuclease/phosphatase family protein [Candidatus Aenigmarchaeota archaeon]